MTVKASTRSIERLAEKVDAIAGTARDLQAMLARRTGHELLDDIAQRVDELGPGTFFEIQYGVSEQQPGRFLWEATVFLDEAWTHPEVAEYPRVIERSDPDVVAVCVAVLKMLGNVTPKSDEKPAEAS